MLSQKTSRPSNLTNSQEVSTETARRTIADGAIFVGLLAMSGLAVIAVAIATPVVLAISAVAGLLNKNSETTGWRPAGA